MSLLSGLLPLRLRMMLLPGALCRNREECNLLTTRLLNTNNPILEQDIFDGMIELDVAPEDFDTYPEEDWSADKWYCLICIKELYRQRFLPWWRKIKQSGRFLDALCSSAGS